MHEHVICDRCIGQFGRRSSVEGEERTESVVQAHREREQQLTITFVEFQVGEPERDGRHQRERRRQRVQPVTLSRCQTLDHLANRRHVAIDGVGQTRENVRSASEILLEEIRQEKSGRGGRDERPPSRVRTLDAPIPLSFAGSGPAEPSVSNGSHSASSSVR